MEQTQIHRIYVHGRGQNTGVRNVFGGDHGVCFLFFFYKFIDFIYLFLAVLGPRCCERAFSSCSERGPLLVVVRGPLTAVASLVAEHGLQACGPQEPWLTGSVVVACELSSCGSWAPERRLSSCGTRA